MTEPGGSGGSDGQVSPTSRGLVTVEELADLDAGLLTEDEERALRARIERDPEAAQLLAALEQVHTDLGELADEPLPDDVAFRLDAALAAEIAIAESDSARAPSDTVAPAAPLVPPAAPDPGTAPVVDLAAARAGGPTGAGGQSGARRRRPGRSRMQRWVVAGVSVAAAAVVAVGVGGIVLEAMQTPQPQPGSAPGDAPILSVADLPAQWPGITEFHDLGFLVTPEELAQCVVGSGGPFITADQVLGSRPVVVGDEYGLLVAVPQDPAAPNSDIRLIVFGPHCDAFSGTGDLIVETVVPR